MTAAKLTLKLDAEVIDLGKQLAKQKGTSLSKLFEQFIKSQVAYDYKPVIILEPSKEILSLTVSGDADFMAKSDKELYAEYMDNLYNEGV